MLATRALSGLHDYVHLITGQTKMKRLSFMMITPAPFKGLSNKVAGNCSKEVCILAVQSHFHAQECMPIEKEKKDPKPQV